MSNQHPRGWHSRGYLPHFDGGEIAQFITIRLHDSIPAAIIRKWELEIERDDPDSKSRIIQLNRKMELYADGGYGECWLRDHSIASVVEDALFYFDNERYRLMAWVIMPNHVHILLTPFADHSMSRIMKSIKNWTSKCANEILHRKGRFWMPDYYDRYIRDSRHFYNVVAYIENNPIKAGLCQKVFDWRFGSAWHRKEQDSL